MIRQIIAITFKELKVLWLDREALALLFADAHVFYPRDEFRLGRGF